MIKYRNAKELISQVAEDLSSYDDQGLIDSTKLYKILRKCNAFLGEKINPEKQAMVAIDNFRGRLPEDFSSLNYAILATVKKVNVTPPSGFHVEYKTLVDKTKCPTTPCVTECNNDFVIIQKHDSTFQEFSKLDLVTINTRSIKHCNGTSPNLFVSCHNSIDISDDGWITSNFQSGDLFLNYTGSMEDEDGELLILDHPSVEGYYEAALRKQIFMTILYNKDGDVAELYKDSIRALDREMVDAIHFVNMTGYNELRDLYQSQRERLYRKFFAPILGTN